MIPAATAVLALRSKGAPIVSQAITDAGFAISVQCWSFKKFTLFESMKMAAAAGASGLELFVGQKIGGKHGDAKLDPGMDDALCEAVANELEENGLIALNLGVLPVPNDEAKARVIFDFAKRFKLYGITTESLESVLLLEKLAAEYDIKVCFHNHPKPTKLWNPETIWKAIDGSHENLGFCADLGHWATSGLDPLEVVKKIAPRIHSFHMKDREKIGEWSHDRPFGTGMIKLPEILDAVGKEGFKGNVSIEYEHNWDDNLVEVARCAGFLTGYAKTKSS